MKNIVKTKAGFTMVELMLVVIIVGILAAVAIPLYKINIERALRTEATTTLGAIVAAERLYKMEFGTYTAVVSSQIGTVLLGADITDPHYFDGACYDVINADSAHFLTRCTVNNTSSAPGATQAKKFFPDIVFAMDQTGTISP